MKWIHSYFPATVITVAGIGVLGCGVNLPRQSSLPDSERSDFLQEVERDRATTPSKAQSTQETLLGSGKFQDGEHPTKGTATILEKDGIRSLRLEKDFSTSSSGPDLFVILHRSADVIGGTTPPDFPLKVNEYTLVAPLKKYNGSQSYTLSGDIDLREFKSVAIWCRMFNATFCSAAITLK